MPTGHSKSDNYLVITQGEKWKFKERKEIHEAFGMSLSTIRNIIRGEHQKKSKKYKDFKIFKIKNKIV
jgi:Mg2+ and Co2+ transporter CorA